MMFVYQRRIPDLPSLKPKFLGQETWLKIRGILVVVGGFLVEFALGSHYTFSEFQKVVLMRGICLNHTKFRHLPHCALIYWIMRCTV